MKGFAFARRVSGSVESAVQATARNFRELSIFLNKFVVRFDADGSTLTLPANLGVAGDATFNGLVTVPTPSLSTDAASKGYVDGLLPLSEGDFSGNTNKTLTTAVWTDLDIWNVDNLSGGGNITLTSSTSFTTGSAGLWLMHAELRFANSGTGGRRIRFDVGGTPRSVNRTATINYTSTTFVGRLGASDVVKVQAQQTSGGNLDVTAADSRWYIARISS